MRLYCDKDNYKLYQGNMLDMLEDIEPNSIDAIITDPPYELNFMNKGWDNSGIAFQADTWKRCLEVLKPGGYLLAFGGSRTFHRVACAIEDAGFEIRDTIMWIYGSGFPKSMNIGLALDKKNGVESIDTGIVSPNARPNCDKSNTLYESGTVGKEFTIKKATNEWDGWGTALKPSFEPIVVARKPFKGTLLDNIVNYGVGGFNIDECRVEYEKTQNPATNPLYRQQNADKYKQVQGGELSNGAVSWTSGKNGVNEGGRFPANTILTYDLVDIEEVCGGFPDTKSQKTNSKLLDIRGNNYNNSTKNLDIAYERGYDDSGSASRYFYCAKASKRDRDEGLDKKNNHPTVKPCSLMQYLIRLVCPKGAVILDPFNGSGSTGKAVMYENLDRDKNYKYIGIELEEDYLAISKARIDYAKGDTYENV